MTPTHEAALNIARDSFAMFAAALEGLPDEALSWTPPAKDANSIAVLGSHCVTSFRFFLPLGAGQVGSIEEYRRGERAESFRVERASRTLCGPVSTRSLRNWRQLWRRARRGTSWRASSGRTRTLN